MESIPRTEPVKTQTQKRIYVASSWQCEPELMYREATILGSMPELFDAFGEPGSVS
jgi:hypothetical protein